MKRSNFWEGFVCTLMGLGLLTAAAVTETRLDSLLWGLSGAALGPGLMQLWKYRYWTRPERKDEYAQRLEYERIAMKDERNRMLRDRARAAAFMIGVYVICAWMLVCCILDAWGIPAGWNTVVLSLAGYLVLEFVAYYMAYQKLDKKN